MINITAVSEKTAQVIHEERVDGSSGMWWAIRLVGWISQDASADKTTLYFKWQTGALNYWPYDNSQHTYIVTLGGKTVTHHFSLPLDKTNAYIDKTSVGSIELSGSNSSTLTIQGFKCWEEFTFSDTVSFPAIVSPGGGSTVVKESVPFVNDNDPRFYILADGEFLYSMNDESRYLLNPSLTLEINQTDSLDFTVPPTNHLYSKLKRLSTTIEVRQGKEVLFRGRVLNDDTDFDNMMQVHCEGALAFLGDTVLNPYSEDRYHTAKEFFEDAMDQHHRQVPSSTPKRRLKAVRCNVTSEIQVSNEAFSSTSDMISTLLNEVGGYLKLEYYDNGETGLSYLNASEHTSTQIIDFGENLIDLTKSVDASSIFTAVVCVGAVPETEQEEETPQDPPIITMEDSEAIETYGRITRVFEYDDITDPAELQAIGQYQLLLGSQLSMTVSVRAIDLHIVYPDHEKIRIGDNVRIRSMLHGIDSYFQCSRIDIDIQDPANTVYTFGGTLPAITDISKNGKASKQSIPIPQPTNVASYYQDAAITMRNTLAGLNKDWISILFVTDMHSTSNSLKSQDIALYLLRHSNLSFAVFNGDFCAQGFDTDDYHAYVDKLLKSDQKAKLYFTIGNHDVSGESIIAEDFLAKKDAKYGSKEEGYYYFDDSSRKFRFLFLNTSNRTGDWLGVSDEELTWITNSVKLPDSTWSLVIFGHENLADAGLSSELLNPQSPTMTCTNGADVLSAIATCNGTIVGYFCGHQHIDRSTALTVGNRTIRQTMFLCDKIGDTPYYNLTYPTRTAGTTSEQSITIISINTKSDSRKVDIRRIGSEMLENLSYTY